MEKLKDVIRRPDFKPGDYGGFMVNDFQFSKVFSLKDKTLKEVFTEVNDFLGGNGFGTFEFGEFSPELSIIGDGLNLYADPHSREGDGSLILLINKYNPLNNPIDQLILELVRFRNERDWEQFHNAKDLAIGLSIEASELLELFLWKGAQEAKIEKIKEELADVFAYALLLADKYGLDVKEIVLDKIQRNAEKYPVEKSKGSAKKYNEL